MANSKATTIAEAGDYPLRHNKREAKVVETAESYVPDETTDWASTDPATLSAAIDRLAASMSALLAKLDADAGVTDTDYASTLLP